MDDISDASLVDTASLPVGRRSLYIAYLAKIWWKFDEVKARLYLDRAGKQLLDGISSAEKNELNEQLSDFPNTFRVISGLDAKFAQRILKELEKTFLDTATGKAEPNAKLADIYTAVGLEVVVFNPRFALDIGKESLKFGFALSLPQLVIDLNLQNSDYAEELFNVALAAASKSSLYGSDTMLFNLSRFIAESNKGKSFSPILQRKALTAFIGKLEFAVSTRDTNPRACSISYYGPFLVGRVGEYLPELLSRFRELLLVCTANLHPDYRERTAANIENVPNTVDELLKSAREAKSPDMKINRYREVFLQLLEAKKYEQMISLLDGFDGDAYKEISPIGWDNWRVSAASGAAIAAFEVGDIPSSFRFVNDVPKRLRPFVRKRAVLNKKIGEDEETYIEHLNEMQKELDSIEIPSHDAARLYLDLAEFYLKTTPTESQLMFRNAIKHINKADNDNPDLLPEKDWAPMEDYVSLSADLLEADDMAIFSSMKDISSRHSRLRLSLGLLESSLKKLDESKKQLDALKSKQKKK
ncbi:hypothetical protein [Leptolyngbya sp. 7M]|uniref:hypothetical protein n=1 Tax=Leptolyngbya sp. 7M TaxID=2812896 RepID=UPI001B8D41B2|nr:hypothetical protein [Leptolyngbya sp. 7M]QYO65958.1 hypothetical protein JVX88_03930 [Leptolyngbya sp. 7M]